MSVIYWWFVDNFFTVALIGACVALVGIVASAILGVIYDWPSMRKAKTDA